MDSFEKRSVLKNKNEIRQVLLFFFYSQILVNIIITSPHQKGKKDFLLEKLSIKKMF